jgi:hypothetical protein
MKEVKKSFILYIDTLDISDHLSDKKLGKFFRAIINFQKNKEYDLPKDLILVFELFKKQFIRDENEWNKVLKAKSLGGRKSAEIRKQKRLNPTKSSSVKDTSAMLNNTKDSLTSATVNVKGNVNVSDNINVNKKKKSKANASPLASIEEIETYFLKKTDDILFSKNHARKFFDHYESNGWKVGINPMKRWKNAVNGWINRQPEFEKEKTTVDLEKSGLLIRKSKS